MSNTHLIMLDYCVPCSMLIRPMLSQTINDVRGCWWKLGQEPWEIN